MSRMKQLQVNARLVVAALVAQVTWRPNSMSSSTRRCSMPRGVAISTRCTWFRKRISRPISRPGLARRQAGGELSVVQIRAYRLADPPVCRGEETLMQLRHRQQVRRAKSNARNWRLENSAARQVSRYASSRLDTWLRAAFQEPTTRYRETMVSCGLQLISCRLM